MSVNSSELFVRNWQSCPLQNFHFLKTRRTYVLVSFGCCNKWPRSWWLKTTQVYTFLPVMEVRKLKSLGRWERELESRETETQENHSGPHPAEKTTPSFLLPMASAASPAPYLPRLCSLLSQTGIRDSLTLTKDCYTSTSHSLWLSLRKVAIFWNKEGSRPASTSTRCL